MEKWLTKTINWKKHGNLKTLVACITSQSFIHYPLLFITCIVQKRIWILMKFSFQLSRINLLKLYYDHDEIWCVARLGTILILTTLLILTTSVDVWVLGLGFLVFINICDASRLTIRSKYVPSIVIASPSSLHWINLSLLTSRIVNASWNKTWWMSINKFNNQTEPGDFTVIGN